MDFFTACFFKVQKWSSFLICISVISLFRSILLKDVKMSTTSTQKKHLHYSCGRRKKPPNYLQPYSKPRSKSVCIESVSEGHTPIQCQTQTSLQPMKIVGLWLCNRRAGGSQQIHRQQRKRDDLLLVVLLSRPTVVPQWKKWQWHQHKASNPSILQSTRSTLTYSSS